MRTVYRIYNVAYRWFLSDGSAIYPKKGNEYMDYLKKLLDHEKRGEQILQLYRKGKKKSEIARQFGLSRQRIAAIISNRTKSPIKAKGQP